MWHVLSLKSCLFRRSVSVLAACVLAVAACATPKVLHPPEETLRTRLDGAGIVPVETSELASIEKPVGGAGSGAAVGAGQGALGTFGGLAAGGCQAGGPYGCALGLALGVVLMPVGALVGAGVGAGRAHSEEEVAAAATAIERRLTEARHAVGIAAEVERIARLRGRPEFARRKPGESLEAFAGRVPVNLTISVGDLAVHAEGRIEPDVRIVMTAYAAVTDRKTRKELYRQGWIFTGTEVPYFRLGANDGAGLQKQFETAHRQLAEAILDHLVYDKSPQPLPEAHASVRPRPSEFLRDKQLYTSHPAIAAAPRSMQEPEAHDSLAQSSTGLASAGPEWDGRWVARGDGWALEMIIDRGKISGTARNNTGCRPCAIVGKIDPHGWVNAYIPSADFEAESQIRGRMPTLKLERAWMPTSQSKLAFQPAAAGES